MTAKKTKIDLSGLQRVNPEPLRQTLKKFGGLKTDIASARARLSALKKEVDDFLENTDPDDTARLQIISAKRTQLEILPKMIARAERQLENELAPALCVATESFRAALKRFYDDAHASIAESVAGFIGRYFSKDALIIAKQCDECREVMLRREQAEAVQIDDQPRSNRPESYDSGLYEAAEALLALAERE